jgi:HK97 family phage major capsid protein
MKKSIELKEQRSEVISKLEAISNTADAAKEELTNEQSAEVETLLERADSLETQITKAEKLEKTLRESALISGVAVEPKADKDLEKFTFQAAMRAAYTGKVEGIIKEMDQEARRNAHYTGQTFRGIGVPASILTEKRTAAETAAVNSTQTMSFTDQLQSNLVLVSAGANFYGGVENMKFPVISGVNSTWMPESGGTAGTPTGTASSVTLSPKKVISVVNVSNEALTQNAGLEAALQRNMAANLAATLEIALLDTSDVSNAPASIFADASAGSTGAVFSGATALTLEEDYLGNDGTYEGARMAYLMDADAYAAIKVAQMVSNVSAAWDNRDKTVNGFYGFVSSNVASSGTADKDHVLFGDFSKCHIAQFGGIDLLYDPYTNGATGEPRMIVTSLVDGDAVQNATAFSSLVEA